MLKTEETMKYSNDLGDQHSPTIVDFSYFLQLAEGDKHFVDRMVYLLIDTFEDFKTEYQYSFESQDFYGLSRTRHKIVGSLNVLKSRPLLDLMDESRQLQRNHTALAHSVISKHLKKIEMMTNAVLEVLKRRVPIIGQKGLMQG